MMTTREDPTKLDPGNMASPKDPAAKSEPTKKIDPWHFGAHTVPPHLRAELSNIELPDAPVERRYRPQAPHAEPEPTEELRIPTRDFRRSVLLGLGALVLVVGGGALSRCLAADTDDVTPPGEPPAARPRNGQSTATALPVEAAPAEPWRAEAAAVTSAAPPPAPQPAPSAAAAKTTSASKDKERPAPVAAPKPPTDLPPVNPPLSTSARPSSRIVPPED